VRKYRFLCHTADAKFQALGQTLEEAFANAALATSSLMWDWRKVEKKVEYPVRAEGRDLEQLLVKFLEEILYLLDTKGFLLNSAEDMRIHKIDDGYVLNARFLGDNYSDRYTLLGDVKAITYNEMSITKNDHYTVQVVVDI
jgi:SHS2 domain-containing protein